MTSRPPESSSTRGTRTRKSDGRQALRRKPDPAVYYATPSPHTGAIIIHGVPRYVREGDAKITNAEGVLVDAMPMEAVATAFEPADTPVFTLSAAHLTRLASVLPVGATATPESLTKAIEARIVFEGAELTFSPGQRAELAVKAQKAGMTLEAYLTYLRNRFLENVWSL